MDEFEGLTFRSLVTVAVDGAAAASGVESPLRSTKRHGRVRDGAEHRPRDAPDGSCASRDHTDDEAVERLFSRVERESSRIDVLVNNAWGGYERMVENGRFTWALPFWEQPRWRWDAMITAGVRAAFVASQLAAQRWFPLGAASS
jgi:NAD(P)-dependent dehydrogenase (short-subunit alcohol dehydrogenase family)